MNVTLKFAFEKETKGARDTTDPILVSLAVNNRSGRSEPLLQNTGPTPVVTF